jgi:hypothetical protein
MVKIAICYFGLTRSIRFIYRNHYENIFDVIKENGAEYDVFLHTWTTEAQNNTLWDQINPIPIDYNEHNFFKPLGYQIDSEEEFLETVNMSDYYYEHEKDIEHVEALIKNHVCSLESLKRSFKLCLDSNIKYDYIIFSRPDISFGLKLPYNEVFENKLKIPNSMVISHDKWFLGYNDYFMIMNFDDAKIYGERVDQLTEYRKNVKPIIPEECTRYFVDKYYKPQVIHLPIDIVRPQSV